MARLTGEIVVPGSPPISRPRRHRLAGGRKSTAQGLVEIEKLQPQRCLEGQGRSG